MKNENAPTILPDDEKTQVLGAVVHLMREAGFSDGFFSPEEQAAFQSELDSMELSVFKDISHEHMEAILRRIDVDIKKLGLEPVTRKALGTLKDKALQERVFAAALHIARAGGKVVPEELKYLKRLKEKFHFSDAQVEALVKKTVSA
ncbi:MAG: tellurite resistance TerB family protein [Spirochaetes bacterium]|nr:tellurite resistance TerB family protein [Spirochaetota bacterium]